MVPYRRWPYLCGTRHWEGLTQRLPNDIDSLRDKLLTGGVLYRCGASHPNTGCCCRHPGQANTRVV